MESGQFNTQEIGIVGAASHRREETCGAGGSRIDAAEGSAAEDVSEDCAAVRVVRRRPFREEIPPAERLTRGGDLLLAVPKKGLTVMRFTDKNANIVHGLASRASFPGDLRHDIPQFGIKLNRFRGVRGVCSPAQDIIAKQRARETPGTYNKIHGTLQVSKKKNAWLENSSQAFEKRQLPTLPLGVAVPSARVGLTTLFGMGRGGSPLI